MPSRLSAALSGPVPLPEGRVLLWRPPADVDLDALAGDVVATTGFRPDHDALSARGVALIDPPDGAGASGMADAAIVFLPRAKALALDLIARASETVPAGAPIVVDGAKADGIESALKACRAAFAVGEVVSKAHGKCFAFPAASAPAGWRAAPREVDGFLTAPGTFSADGIDPGSALLAEHVSDLKGRVCDLGAGWGYLSRAVLRSEAVSGLDLVEAERAALDCARRNVADPRAAFHWADARRFEGGPYDWIVTNPPFHAGRRADPDLGRAFLAAGARLLAPRGRLRLVANRHLPYEATLSEAFAESVVLAERGGYKVIEATRPRRTR